MPEAIIKISVRDFIKKLYLTDDEVWGGILSRKYWSTKLTLKEWRELLNQIKVGKK